MKKKVRCFLAFILVCLVGCTTDSSVSSTNDDRFSVTVESRSEPTVAPAYNATNTPDNNIISVPTSNPQVESSVPEINDNPINISSSNEAVPDGIFEQLAWVSIGGGGPKDHPCGNCSISINDSAIVGGDFRPLQKISVGLYRITGTDECFNNIADYVTSVYIQADEDGSLNSSLSGSITDIFIGYVVDSDTNEMIWSADYIYLQNECKKVDTSTDGNCPDAPPQHLEINMTAYVCTATDTVKLREGPGRNYSEIKSLVPGAEVKVVDGPECANNWSWWKVETQSGYIGWMSEGGDSVDKYYLCPK